MNGRFKRMLEPGERILVRSTDGNMIWYLAGALMLLASLMWVRAMWGSEFPGFPFGMATLVFMTVASLVSALAWQGSRWEWVITDRRVLKGHGMFSSDIGEMRHETIEGVRLNDTTLALHGRDDLWEFKISRAFCRADILYGLFGARMGEPGLPAKPLEDMLEPGETVPWRGSPLVTDLLPWVILFSGPLALAVLMAWPDYSWYGSKTVIFFYLGTLVDVFAFWRRRGWQTAITDRRLLRRRPEAPSRCDSIPLGTVTKAHWNRWKWTLTIVSPGRCDEFFCVPWTARRVIDTLKRNDHDKALAR